MYTEHFGLKLKPFENTPDPSFLFLSEQHREVMASLVYGIDSAKGFILIAGEVGTGKTTIINALLKDLKSSYLIIHIVDPHVLFDDLVFSLAKKLNIGVEGRNRLDILEEIKDKLVDIDSNNGRVVFVIDEAHLLSAKSLGEIRLLSNIETARRKLLQIVLVGQTEIYKKLQTDDLKSLRQRIVINRTLEPLDRKETERYIEHRLNVAGGDISLFQKRALSLIWKKSKGVPRTINQVCDNALLIGLALNVKTIGKDIIQEVVCDMQTGYVCKPGLTNYLHTFRQGILVPALLLVVSAVSVWLVYTNADFSNRRNLLRDTDRHVLLQQSAKQISENNTQSLITAHPGLRIKDNNSTAPNCPAVQDNAFVKHLAVIKKNTVLRQAAGSSLFKGNQVFRDQGSVARHADVNADVFARHYDHTNKSKKHNLATDNFKDVAFHDALSNRKTSERRHVLPFNTLYIPEKMYLITISDSNSGVLWRGTYDNRPQFMGNISARWDMGKGLFFLVRNRDNKKTILNYRSFLKGDAILQRISIKLPERMSTYLIPVYVYSSDDRFSGTVEDPLDIEKIVRNWSRAWCNKDVGRFMSFYSDIIITFREGMDKPITYTKRELRNLKKKVFEKSGTILISISKPLCMIDPENPDLAVAVFHEKYVSAVYSDSGTKVLYLSRSRKTEGRKWRIFARFWVKDM